MLRAAGAWRVQGSGNGCDWMPCLTSSTHDQVAVDAPACDAGGRHRRDKLLLEREIAHRLGPCIGHDHADRAQMAQQGVRVGRGGGRRADDIVWGRHGGWRVSRYGGRCLGGRRRQAAATAEGMIGARRRLSAMLAVAISRHQFF